MSKKMCCHYEVFFSEKKIRLINANIASYHNLLMSSEYSPSMKHKIREINYFHNTVGPRLTEFLLIEVSVNGVNK